MEPDKPEELVWWQKETGEPERDYLWWEKDATDEVYTAEDSLWQRYYNNGGGPGDGFGLLSFWFEGLLYRIYFVGPACAFNPTFDDPEAEFLEAHEWETWGELMETIRWKNGKTLSEMMRTITWPALEYQRHDVPERYIPKNTQTQPESTPPKENTPPESAPLESTLPESTTQESTLETTEEPLTEPDERFWWQKETGSPKRGNLWMNKDGVEPFTAEDLLWYLYDNNGGGPGDGDGRVSFTFEGVLYRIYTVGPACAFRPAPEDPEAELLESHDWDTWGELMETLRWKNGYTLSEMMRTAPDLSLTYDEADGDSEIPLRYTPKDAGELDDALGWDEKGLGNPKRNRLYTDKCLEGEVLTAEDSLWNHYYDVPAGPGDGFGLLNFWFDGLLYRIYCVGPACSFNPTFDDPEAEFLEAHDWDTWGELLETIRWKNGKTLSEMMRTITWPALEYEQGDVPERYIPKEKQTPPEASAPPESAPET